MITALGAGLKGMLNTGLVYAYIGQTLAGIAQPIIINSPGKIASTWFREDRVNIID